MEGEPALGRDLVTALTIAISRVSNLPSVAVDPAGVVHGPDAAGGDRRGDESVLEGIPAHFYFQISGVSGVRFRALARKVIWTTRHCQGVVTGNVLESVRITDGIAPSYLMSRNKIRCALTRKIVAMCRPVVTPVVTSEECEYRMTYTKFEPASGEATTAEIIRRIRIEPDNTELREQLHKDLSYIILAGQIIGDDRPIGKLLDSYKASYYNA